MLETAGRLLMIIFRPPVPSIGMNFSTSCICADPHYSGRDLPYRSYGIKSYRQRSAGKSFIMFCSAFDGTGAEAGDYYPRAASKIDELNGWL